MSKLNKIITTVFRSFSIPIFSFVFSILGIRYFGKQNWGEFIYILTWIYLFAFVANFGNKDYLLRKYSLNPSKITSYFSTNIFSRTILLSFSVILFIVFPLKIAFVSFLLVSLIFIYQSLDSLIIYHQTFLKQLIAEIIGFVLISGYFLYTLNFNISHLIFVYCIAYFLKIIYLLINNKYNIQLKNTSFSIAELKQSFPFFLIIFSGWIASKMDLYIVNFTMSKEHISEYQLGITAFLLLQSISYLIILPFNKHLYRLNIRTIKILKKKLTLLSLPIILIGTIAIWFLLEKIVKLNLPLMFYIFGALSSMPIYFYIIDIMMYYKENKEKSIIKISLIVAFINMILTFYLLKFYGIIGGVISVFIIQYIILLFYKSKVIK